MLIIGEKINSTRTLVDDAVRRRDRETIAAEAKHQADAGAHYLDVNCGTLDTADEPAAMEWLVRVTQEAAGLPLCIDSPNPEALAAGLAVHQGTPLINSISGEKERFANVLPLVQRYEAGIVALCLDDRGIPGNRETAEAVGSALVDDLLSAGIPENRIYLDPLVRSVATNRETVIDTLNLMQALHARHPGMHFVSGLSNVSFGLPERRHLNRAYAVMSIASGLDAVILDPLDPVMMALVFAAEALVKRDRFCLSYIRAFNEGKLKV
ncbi:MAG: dihydropteroate synthase [Desulfobacterales bacterium]